MQLVRSIVRRDTVENVRQALGKLAVASTTVTEANRVEIAQPLRTADSHLRGRGDLVASMQIETVVPDTLVAQVVSAIIKAARMGEVGNGRVVVTRLAAAEPETVH